MSISALTSFLADQSKSINQGGRGYQYNSKYVDAAES